MSILDIFRNPAQQPAPTPQQVPVQQVPATPAQPGNIPDQKTVVTKQDGVTDPNGVVPAADPNANASTPDSPLSQFESLWETKPNEGTEQTQQPIALNPDDVRKAVAKTDFTQVITPDQLTAIAAGGEEAQKAFAQAMNAVAQQTLTQATLVSNKLTEKAVTDAIAAQQAKLPEMLRSQAVSNHLKDTNPLFDNPAVKPVIDATRSQLQTKFPNATPAEIAEMAQNFVVAMGESFAPKPESNSTGAGETDWENFLS